ncbi:hypothetical protein Q5P01_015867 [Channa striata]|uniref:Uncharacterized protein n=1 Tax=Channa striata TaxID=64152 RepID=A0AA88MD45_CHASR|nr:hypothetical protein Q5P01_015867 [Channa striata]
MLLEDSFSEAWGNAMTSSRQVEHCKKCPQRKVVCVVLQRTRTFTVTPGIIACFQHEDVRVYNPRGKTEELRGWDKGTSEQVTRRRRSHWSS